MPDNTRLRYVVRSTMNGDTELLIDTVSFKTTVRKELMKPGCNKPWEKSCFDEKKLEFLLSKKTIQALMNSIKKNKVFDLKIDDLPQPTENQYSIGLLEKATKPKYVNCVHGKLDEYPGIKKVQQQFQKIVDSEMKKN